MGQETLSQVQEIVDALQGNYATHRVEDAISSGEPNSRTVVSREQMEARAGELYDLVNRNGGLSKFLANNPDCARALQFQRGRDGNYLPNSGFAQVLAVDFNNGLSREEFSKVIGGQANFNIAQALGQMNGATAITTEQMRLSTNNAAFMLQEAYQRAHPNMTGEIHLTPAFMKDHDANRDGAFSLPELQKAYQDLAKNPAPFTVPKDLPRSRGSREVE